jgi:EKC/KEOPS complex subunit PCC1/LAGE3
VQRTFSLIVPEAPYSGRTQGGLEDEVAEESKTVLQTVYAATTNRMLRVAVNGFMESLGVVLGVMEELDVDVLAESEQS